MAKKKKKVTKKTARSARKAKPAKKAAAKKSSGGDSVDMLLKRFAKDRTSKESELDSIRKKIVDLKERVAKFQDQIAKLDEQEQNVQSAISQLDQQRDQEVSVLLAKLGVQLGTAQPVSASTEGDAEEMPTLRLGGAG